VEINYKNFNITTDGFESMQPEVHGKRALFEIIWNNQRCIFVFAVSGMAVATQNLKEKELVDKAIRIIKPSIDRGLKPNKEYTYEWKYSFIKVNNPSWWKKTRKRR